MKFPRSARTTDFHLAHMLLSTFAEEDEFLAGQKQLRNDGLHQEAAARGEGFDWTFNNQTALENDMRVYEAGIPCIYA